MRHYKILAISAWAPALLKETLTVMTARVVEPASITLQLMSNTVVEDFIATDARIASALRSSLAVFVQAIKEHELHHDDPEFAGTSPGQAE